MFEYLKKLASRKVTQNESLVELNEIKKIEELDGIKVLDNLSKPKYIIKEDAKRMSFPCDHKNNLPQSLLKIDKKLITDPDKVQIYVNLAHFNNVDTLEEGVIEYPEIENPCGTGTIQGKAYLEKVIIVAGVHYSVLLYDTVTMTKVYDGDIEYLTAYSLYKVLPLGIEVEIDPTKLVANFNTELKRLENIDELDYYLYTVDGTVDLVYTGPLVTLPEL